MLRYANLIIILSHIPILATVVSALLLYKRLGRTLKVFSWFIFLSGAIQFTSLFLWYSRMNNMPLLHVYVAGGFVCLGWFYRSVLGNFVHRAVIGWTTALFVAFCVMNALFFQPLTTFNSYALMIESVLVIILSLFTFLFLLNHTIRESGIPDVKSLAWINSGLFIYFLSCFLIYYFSNFMMTQFSALYRVAWIFHSFFSVVMYSCFLIGLWKRSKTPVF